jgi:glutaredoxin
MFQASAKAQRAQLKQAKTEKRNEEEQKPKVEDNGKARGEHRDDEEKRRKTGSERERAE